ncbi:hypothetical protein SPRG_00896 [Saprolegnia parasitica CBS 223.65]|uniref:AMP-dependent synthetase/ligase domain-containing protein n=1 Tax=Saprolegnia parasitica (strain CBS 223.65) TaxID=695850 RepID=A0A067CZZ9_SAPPC|nr:hypothetical protein SPRG_00896 [Saprolegnia parasitica CBS 223.65]KDO34835.1 hypothetical protein SPRG_00896 [Saprolegnia parasitica CBS 223.65]|eukprot:XP_012194498.1 hypothetical protein SPRG_00896 [Saprolegnia parasitica CBS 223.65]
MPDIKVHVSPSCRMFFHEDDFEVEHLRQGCCTYCWEKPASLLRTSSQTLLIAIIVPEEAEITRLAASLVVTGTFAELCAHAAINEAVLRDIVAVGKKGKLHGFELIKALLLHPEPFTIENNLATPTFKVKRSEVKKVFGAEIQALYAKTGDVVAGKNVSQH